MWHSASNRTQLTLEDEDVAGLDVSVDQSPIVQKLHGRHELPDDVDGLLLVEAMVLRARGNHTSRVRTVRAPGCGIRTREDQTFACEVRALGSDRRPHRTPADHNPASS